MNGRTPALLVLATAVALLASPALTRLPSAAAQPWPTCDDTTGNYLAGSAYANNTQQLLYSLQSNALSTPALFATGSAGAGADAVYGLLLCRGDMTPTYCFDCGTNAGQDVYRVCNHTRDAALVYNQCYVRLAPTDFLASTNNTGMVGLIGGTLPDGVDVAAYDAAVTRLLNATVRYAVDSSAPSSSPRKYFATGQMVGLDSQLQLPTGIWSMAQCAGDISPAQCRSCLDDLIAQWWTVQFDRRQVGARLDGSRCNLRIDAANFFNGSPMVKLQMNGEVAAPAPAPSTDHFPGGSKHKVLIILVVSITVSCAVVASCVLLIAKLRKGYGKTKLQLRANLPRSSKTEAALKLWRIEESGSDFRLYDFSELAAATGGFSDGNRLGRGGFGPVYKGKLENDEEIAVKRLAAQSDQGLEEFKNEIQLIAKLQHTNLVRLLGCCVQEEEKMLVYEYMPNRSLDFFIFDPQRGALMDWTKRLRIIEGIAHGLLYLHKHSQVRIIHRDLKAGNILLDEDLNPKISDFGMARIFASNMTVVNTNRIVGTYGYMAPEYASEGIFSVRSDVFSFGVLVLEIVSGKKNSGHHHIYGDFINLHGYAWQLWREGREFELIDPVLGNSTDVTSILRCVKVALLCVQDNAIDRPRMTEVVEMLGHDGAVLRDPNQPPHFHLRVSHDDDDAGGEERREVHTQPLYTGSFSTNGMTITTMEGR